MGRGGGGCGREGDGRGVEEGRKRVCEVVQMIKGFFLGWCLGDFLGVQYR